MGESAVADAGAEAGASKPHLKTHAHTRYQRKMMAPGKGLQPTWDEEQARMRGLFESKYKIPFSELEIVKDELGRPYFGMGGACHYTRGSGEYNKYDYYPLEKKWNHTTILGHEEYVEKLKTTFEKEYNRPFTDLISYFYERDSYYVNHRLFHFFTQEGDEYILNSFICEPVWKYIPAGAPENRFHEEGLVMHSLAPQTTDAPTQTTQ